MGDLYQTFERWFWPCLVAWALIIGVGATRNYYRVSAVEAGVAEWVVTGSGGETEFRWIEQQQAGGEQ